MGLNALCVHGHFYQPPREDPLSGLIPDEKGAEPFRNWNERIHAECYLPNVEQNNFEKISFNIGPTLFHWLALNHKSTHDAIVAQENRVFNKFGISNGMAQAYNHVILPLANKRDKETQINWGIADFKFRFGHKPDGMWLPETAVDLETLCVLSDHGIKFTILAPWQVESPEKLDPNLPYFVQLPGKRAPIIVFFYNKVLSTQVSFESAATSNADYFLDHIVAAELSYRQNNPDSLTLIASDGELYGHHKPYRDRFLAYLLNGALTSRDLRMTFPGLWLQDHSPKDFVKISEYTSWSCHHGIIRWMGECNCTPGASWKAPLRWGLEKLADDLDRQYQTFMGQYTHRKWQMRNDYIHVFLREMTLDALIDQYVNHPLTEIEGRKIGFILAAQYERQRIFTSCGWFAESFHRIEPQNNIAYAAQAVWLTKQATGVELKDKATALLKKVSDQRTGLRGDTIFSEKYHRAEVFSETKISYFNASSSFST